MKKRLLATLLGLMMVASLTACGDSAEADDTEPETEVVEDTEAETGAAEEEAAAPEETETASGEFSLMDLTADMVDQGMYANDGDGNELVITLFSAPDETPMVSMFMSAAAGGGDLICGAYGPDNISSTQTDEGITVSTIAITDIYSGDDFGVVFAEKDGEAYVGGMDGSLYEGKYLTPDETITYMASAIAVLSQQ